MDGRLLPDPLRTYVLDLFEFNGFLCDARREYSRDDEKQEDSEFKHVLDTGSGNNVVVNHNCYFRYWKNVSLRKPSRKDSTAITSLGAILPRFTSAPNNLMK